MDPDVIKLFGVMTAIMIPVALGGGVFLLVMSLSKRLRAPSVSDQGDEVQMLRERLEELEAREARIQEIEERLDFIERALPRAREGRPLPEPPRRPTEETPV